MLTADLQARIESLRDWHVDQIAFETGIDWAQFDLTSIQPAQDLAGIDEQRAAISMFAESITLRPAKRKGRGYDESDTEIQFREPNRLVWQATVED